MKTFSYDYIKAINIKAGMLPDIPGTWDKRMGVCQDLAAIMCCMLRTQGIVSETTATPLSSTVLLNAMSLLIRI